MLIDFIKLLNDLLVGFKWFCLFVYLFSCGFLPLLSCTLRGIQCSFLEWATNQLECIKARAGLIQDPLTPGEAGHLCQPLLLPLADALAQHSSPLHISSPNLSPNSSSNPETWKLGGASWQTEIGTLPTTPLPGVTAAVCFIAVM